MKQKLQLLIICIFAGILMPTGAFANFPDVGNTHPNADAIDYLQVNRVVSGAEDGKFYPDNTVTRAELLKMTFLAKGMATGNSNLRTFPDVPNDSWYAPFVSEALSLGIVSGYPDGMFRPHQTVSRIEALKIILNAYDTQLGDGVEHMFTDVPVDSWYAPYVDYAFTNQLIDSSSKTFDPTKGLTRKETAELLYRKITGKHSSVHTDAVNGSLTFPNITLDRPLPVYFAYDEWYTFQGKTTSDTSIINIVFSDGSANKISCRGDVDANKRFYIPCHITEVGTFKIGVFPGYAGVIPDNTVTVITTTSSPSSATDISAGPITYTVDNNETYLMWDSKGMPISKLTFTQNSRSVSVIVTNHATKWPVHYPLFKDFSEGQVTVSVRLADSTQSSFSGIKSDFGPSITEQFSVVQHHYAEQEDVSKIVINDIPWQMSRYYTVSISGTVQTTIENEFLVTEPDGTVEAYAFYQNRNELTKGTSINYDFDVDQTGVYILEINANNGFAVVNRPIYVGDIVPLLPDFIDLALANEEIATVPTTLAEQRVYFLNEINNVRASYNQPPLYLDDTLNNLATYHSNDMAKNLFVGHISSNGYTIEQRRQLFDIKTPIGENVALSKDLASAHEGLVRSASHLQNMIEADWTRVGIGIAKGSDGYFYVTQEYSTRDITEEPLTVAEVNNLKNSLLNKMNLHRSDDVSYNQELSADVTAWLSGAQSTQLTAYLNTKGYTNYLVVSTKIYFFPGNIDDLAAKEELHDSAYKEVGIGIVQKNGMLSIAFAFLR